MVRSLKDALADFQAAVTAKEAKKAARARREPVQRPSEAQRYAPCPPAPVTRNPLERAMTETPRFENCPAPSRQADELLCGFCALRWSLNEPKPDCPVKTSGFVSDRYRK